MFKRPSVHYGRTPAPVTPYQKAAQVWDERIGSARVQAKNWRLIAFGSLVLSAGLASGLVWQSTQGSVTPWVIEVDRLGQAQAVGPANPFYQPNDPQIAFHLARFIENVRGLSADAIVLRQDWLRAYDFTTDRGAAALNNHARVNDPFANLGKVQIANAGLAPVIEREKLTAYPARPSLPSVARFQFFRQPALSRVEGQGDRVGFAGREQNATHDCQTSRHPE